MQFRAGGDESVRGYAYRSLGPLVDGVVDQRRRAVHRQRRGGAPDPGLAAIGLGRGLRRRRPRRGNAAATCSPAVGVGVGVRWRSPVGALRLDLAYGEETAKLRLHFSVGVTF